MKPRFSLSVYCSAQTRRSGRLKLVAVEPEESPVLSGGQPAPHKIQGIGAGFVPAVLDRSVIGEIVKVDSQTALETRAIWHGWKEFRLAWPWPAKLQILCLSTFARSAPMLRDLHRLFAGASTLAMLPLNRCVLFVEGLALRYHAPL